MTINDYTNYKEKTIAEFKVAIAQAENMFSESLKNKDLIGALKAIKIKLKLQTLLNKKTSDGVKNNYSGHRHS